MAISRFAFWNPGTWQIPKLYWDAFSDEQRIHAICKQLGKVIAYADYLGINVEDIADRLKAIEEGELDPYIFAKIEEWFEEHHPQIEEALAALNEALPIEDFDAEHTVKDSLTSLASDISDINALFPLQTASIDDAAITTAKIADDAITTSKITDGAVTYDKIAVNEYEIPDRVQNGDVVIRTIKELTYNLQGMCVFPETTPEYVAIGKALVGDNTLGAVDIYNIATNTRVASIPGAYYHATDITYHDGKLYVSAGGYAPIVNVIDVSNPTNPQQLNTINYTSEGLTTVFGFGVLPDGDFYLVETLYNNGAIHRVDPTTFDITGTICNVPTISGMYQSISYNSYFNLFMFVASEFTNIVFFDMDGTVVRSTALEPQYGFIPLAEIEAACSVGKTIYFSNNPAENYVSTQDLHGAVWKWDIDNNANNYKYTLKYATKVTYVRLTNLATGLNKENTNGTAFAGFDASTPIMIRYPEDLAAIPHVTDNYITLDICNDVVGLIPIIGGTWTIQFDDATAAYKIPGIYITNGANVTVTKFANVPFANVEQLVSGHKTLFNVVASKLAILNAFSSDVSATSYVATLGVCAMAIVTNSFALNNVNVTAGGVCVRSGKPA